MATVSTVQFDAESHIYRDGDEIVPSVTQCLELAGICPTVSTLPAVVQRNYERAAAIGTEVHRCCELLDKDDLVLDSMDDLVLPYVVAYQKFKEETGFRPTEIEQRGIAKEDVTELVYGYCIDRVGTVEDKKQLGETRLVLDLKTTAKPSASWAIQTAAYAYTQDDYPEDVNRAVVHLKKDGKYEIINYVDENDYDVWTSVLRIAHWKLKHGTKLR